jgi:phosphotransferase system HPr (HPr) family protein
MVKEQIEIINKAGLHARAASKLVELTSTFACDIQIGQDTLVDAKSILSLMMLAAVKGSTLNLMLEGPDEELALKAIINLVNDRFGESE